jgi:hypothetical protein
MAFSGELMLASDFEAEGIARQIERSDLTPAVAEDLAGSYRALGDFVHVLRRLGFTENFLVGAERRTSFGFP